MDKKKNALTPKDWEIVWKFYCAGIKPLRDIASEFGITEGAIRKRAKRDGWVRNLTGRIQAKAEDLVRKQEVRKLGTQTNHSSEKVIIDANANAQSAVILNERKDVSRARKIAMSLLAQLEAQITDRDLYEKFGEILSRPDEFGNSTKIKETYYKILSFGGRIESMKRLAETLKILIELERKVYRIDEVMGEGGVEDFLRNWNRV